MESDGKYIEARFGKAQSFKVPDGYFDSLVQSVMENVGEQVAATEPHESACAANTGRKTNTAPLSLSLLWQRYRRYCAAAACALLILGGASAYMASVHDSAGTARASASGDIAVGSHVQSGSSYDEELDYTMLDNEGMYSLMASN